MEMFETTCLSVYFERTEAQSACGRRPCESLSTLHLATTRTTIPSAQVDEQWVVFDDARGWIVGLS